MTDSNIRQLPMFDPIEIRLTKGYVALVDPVDADLAALNWCACKRNDQLIYAYRQPGHINIFMHRIILTRMTGRDLSPKEVVDHINGNGLDNRRCNIRMASRAENVRNQRRGMRNTSGYKGVSLHKASDRWQAVVRHDGILHYLGLFDSPELAHAVYCEAARKYHGEFANFGDTPAIEPPADQKRLKAGGE